MNFKKIFLGILSLFILVSTVSASDTFYKNGKWITHTEDCQNFFHDSHMIGTEGVIKGTSTCSCEGGFKLNSTKNKCIPVSSFSIVEEVISDNNNKNLFSQGRCSSDLIMTQNLRAPRWGYVRNGKYDRYTRGIVREAHILQKHLNRLGFNAGPVDGIIGPKTRGAILRLQRYLGTTPDGYVGPKTRALLNNSCGENSVIEEEKVQNKELSFADRVIVKELKNQIHKGYYAEDGDFNFDLNFNYSGDDESNVKFKGKYSGDYDFKQNSIEEFQLKTKLNFDIQSYLEVAGIELKTNDFRYKDSLTFEAIRKKDDFYVKLSGLNNIDSLIKQFNENYEGSEKEKEAYSEIIHTILDEVTGKWIHFDSKDLDLKPKDENESQKEIEAIVKLYIKNSFINLIQNADGYLVKIDFDEFKDFMYDLDKYEQKQDYDRLSLLIPEGYEKNNEFVYHRDPDLGRIVDLIKNKLDYNIFLKINNNEEIKISNGYLKLDFNNYDLKRYSLDDNDTENLTVNSKIRWFNNSDYDGYAYIKDKKKDSVPVEEVLEKISGAFYATAFMAIDTEMQTQKAHDAMIKSTLAQIPTQAAIDDITSFANVCGNKNIRSLINSAVDVSPEKHYKCNSSTTNFAVSVKLNSGNYACSDASGLHILNQDIPARSLSCNQVGNNKYIGKLNSVDFVAGVYEIDFDYRAGMSLDSDDYMVIVNSNNSTCVFNNGLRIKKGKIEILNKNNCIRSGSQVHLSNPISETNTLTYWE